MKTRKGERRETDLRRDGSTSGRISRLHKSLNIFLIICSDISAIIISVNCWCIYQRASAAGSFRLSSVLRETAGRFILERTGALRLTYRIQYADYLTDVPADGFFAVLIISLLAVVAAEAVILVIASIIGSAGVREQLRSLDDLAKEARSLARADLAKANMEREENARRLENLKREITNLSLDEPEMHIDTEDEDLKGLENAVNDLVFRLNESYRQQVRFVSDASHELRTPIAVIKGYADMLSRWGSSDERVLRESIDAIKSETESMNRLVEQLLFLARSDSGRTVIKLEPISLTDIAREVYSECEMIDEKHSYRLSADDEVDAVGDSAMLKQTMRILTDNAAKYTPEGGTVFVRVGRSRSGAPWFSVEDSGIGISPTDVSDVFNRFYRADGGREINAKGTGLGLSIAKWIVDRMGGDFDIVSVEGVGTRFTVTLPSEKIAE